MGVGAVLLLLGRISEDEITEERGRNMREYGAGNKLKKAICNNCKKELRVERGILKEGIFEGIHTFGFFSNKDGMTHKFDLCEECYDRMVGRFLIPVTEIEEKEIM